MRREEFEKKAKPKDASRLKVGIVLSKYNEDITGNLLAGALDTLAEWGVKDKNIFRIDTYGSFELPYAAAKLIKRHKVQVVVALGCIVKGDTKHDQYIAAAVFQGLTDVSLQTRVPVGLGVLTVETLEQAKVRSEGTGNHGAKAALAALEAALA